MNRRTVYLAGAVADLRSAVSHYREVSPTVAQRFLAQLKSTVSGIEAFPTSGTRVDDTLRARRLSTFPFSVVYVASDDELIIVAVAHQRREPGYWNG